MRYSYSTFLQRKRQTNRVSPDNRPPAPKVTLINRYRGVSKHDATWAARKLLSAAIDRHHSKDHLQEALLSDTTIQKYFSSIPMESTELSPLRQEEAMYEALSRGWVVNGESFNPSPRSGKHYASIQTVRKLCRHMCDLGASFCIDPDDIFRKILQSSSGTNTAMDCELTLSALMLEKHPDMHLTASISSLEQNPVEMVIFPRGSDCEGSPIFCAIRFTYSFQLVRSTSGRGKSNVDDDSNTVDTSDNIDASDNVVLSFDAIVSECFSFHGSGKVDNVRSMEILVNDD